MFDKFGWGSVKGSSGSGKGWLSDVPARSPWLETKRLERKEKPKKKRVIMNAKRK